jgi:hypothetical protein
MGKVVLALFLSLLLSGLGACGDGGDPESTTRPGSTPAVPTEPPVPPVPGPQGVVIVDNAGPGFSVEEGEWGTCENGDCGGTCYGPDFRFAEPSCPECQARFDFSVSPEGEYDVWTWWPWGDDRATDTAFTIDYSGGAYTVEVDQRNSGDDWYWLVTLSFEEGEQAGILVQGSTSGYANADAIALTPAGSGPPSDQAPVPADGAAPVIQYFYAEESSEGCYYLHWDVTRADDVYLDGEPVDNPGSIEVCPEQTFTYSLWAENEEESTGQDLTIWVGDEEPTPEPHQPPPPPPPPASGAIIIDHTCTDLSQIPEYWLEQAKQLTLHYAHTSHGSQIVTGVEWLEGQDSRYDVAVRYCGDDAGLPNEPGALRICDGNPPGGDYIEPDGYWSSSEGLGWTRAVAETGLFHFSMWSWCGQQADNDVGTVQHYLDTLNQLEQDYPAMRFIYMTGHTDGGDNETLARNNDMVRQYARDHGKVLFDFADIEKYDPGGGYYPYADDSCPWCDDWCSDHPQDCAGLERIDDCAHSHPLICKQKAHAFWWMMARLAGWDGTP